MVETIKRVLENNQAWVDEMIQQDPEFFSNQLENQNPNFLWIGCSDSRVHPNEITQTDAGEIFVHRNFANLVVQTDMNLLSVLQYAVEVLKVRHVVVCGHYGCAGVKTAMQDRDHGLIDNWLRSIKDTQNYYWQQLKVLQGKERENRLVELNVVEQIYNLGKTSVIQQAWKKGNMPYLHGWVYNMETGLIKTQTPMINSEMALKEVCKFEMEVIGH